MLKCVHKKSKYGHLVAIPDYDNQELFSSAARYKGWADNFFIYLSGGKEENKAAMVQYLSKYLYDKYEDEAIFAASQCGLPVSTSMNPESVADIVDYANITLNRLIIICNCIRYAFGKRAILPEE